MVVGSVLIVVEPTGSVGDSSEVVPIGMSFDGEVATMGLAVVVVVEFGKVGEVGAIEVF